MRATHPQYWKLSGDTLSPIREDITVDIDIPPTVLTEEEIKDAADLIYMPLGFLATGTQVYAPASRDVTQCIEITHTDVIAGSDGNMNSAISVMSGMTTLNKVTDVYVNVTEGFVDAGGPPAILTCTFNVKTGFDSSIIVDSSCYSDNLQVGKIASDFNPPFLSNNGFYDGGINMNFEVTGSRIGTLAYGKMLVYITWRQLELPAAPK